MNFSVTNCSAIFSSSKSSSAEVDFLAGLQGRIHPVEVKSGATGSLKSLHPFLAAYPACGKALVFSDRPYADLPAQKITFLPLYSAFAATGGRKLKDAW